MEYFNEISVLTAALTSMAIGALWYAPFMFGKSWMNLSGIDISDPAVEAQMRKNALRQYFGTFVSIAVMAVILKTLMVLLGSDGWRAGATLALAVWFGFVAATSFVNYSFSPRPMKLWLIDSGYHLVSLLVMSAILSI